MHGAQRGFTLIELMVALLIGLFLMGGLLLVVQDNKRTFTSQNAQTRLQDSQRLAMTILTDAVQQAGYFPNPTLYSATGLFTPTQNASFAQAGQSLVGTYSATGSDTLYTRFANVSGDSTVNCWGAPNSTGSATPVVIGDQFSVSGGTLVCAEGFGTQQLVGDANYVSRQPIVLNSLKFLYGVNSAGTAYNVDTYKKPHKCRPPTGSMSFRFR